MCNGSINLKLYRNVYLLSAQGKMQHKKTSLIPMNSWLFGTGLQPSENLNQRPLLCRDVMAGPYKRENMAAFHGALRGLL